jgi:hypothetical protein
VGDQLFQCQSYDIDEPFSEPTGEYLSVICPNKPPNLDVGFPENPESRGSQGLGVEGGMGKGSGEKIISMFIDLFCNQ